MGAGQSHTKPMCSVTDLLQHMKDKGILFNLIDETDAADFLNKHNYYFKLASYRKNYNKSPCGPDAGKYIGLEFAYLVELSQIDMALRYLFLEMCLDIEHFVKVRLVNDIAANPNDNGYVFVQTLEAKYHFIQKALKQAKNSFAAEVVKKYATDCPIWALCEFVSYGDLCRVCAEYDAIYPRRLSFRPSLLFPIRDLRNAAAHNNCLINDVRARNCRPNTEITNFVANNISISKAKRKRLMVNRTIHGIVSLLYVYSKVVTNNAAIKRKREEVRWLMSERMAKNRRYFAGNTAIMNTYVFIRKVFKKLFPSA